MAEAAQHRVLGAGQRDAHQEPVTRRRHLWTASPLTFFSTTHCTPLERHTMHCTAEAPSLPQRGSCCGSDATGSLASRLLYNMVIGFAQVIIHNSNSSEHFHSNCYHEQASQLIYFLFADAQVCGCFLNCGYLLLKNFSIPFYQFCSKAHRNYHHFDVSNLDYV